MAIKYIKYKHKNALTVTAAYDQRVTENPVGVSYRYCIFQKWYCKF